LEQAQSYLNGEDEPNATPKTTEKPSRKKKEPSEETPYLVPEGMLVAFVDGSFDVKTQRYGYGCVLLTDDGRELTENGWGNHPEAISARNVAGELRATMVALRRAEEMGYRSLRICHDYNGIAAWFNGEWKANSFVAREYVAVAESYRGVLDVTFEKIAAHTGVKYNEMADRLAKDALGIE
jgi:ribonuclease HI